MDLRQEEEADQPMGPDPAPEVSPADPDEESAESGDSGRVVSDPREARALEANQAMGSGDEDDEENDENYEPNGELEDSESDNSAENAPKGTTYVWNIDSFSRMSAGQEKHYSDVFKCGDFSCRVLLFPRGNPNNSRNQLSIYVEILEIPIEGLNVQFGFKIINQKDEKQTVSKDGNHKFTKAENDRGFARLIALEELLNEERGFVVGDKLEIHTFVSIRRVEMSRMMEPRISYDSKKETGFVGLKNQGATCYMNSLLQFFFHIPRLREAVYNMPTEDAKEGLPLALQRVFYHLQTNLKSVDTKALTKSFGWGSMDSFMQHDVQEFSRLLCDKLEEKMKNTKVDGMIAELFQGKLENFIECINVNYESTRMENFYDLSLMVKGCPTLYDSFKQYVEVEKLEGDNKYRAEGHGKQDANKGCRFRSFPPVMHLHLKRFEYDMIQNIMVKLNDSFEFPTQIDVSEFVHESNDDEEEQEISKEPAAKPGDGESDKPKKIKKAETTLKQHDATKKIGDNLYLLHSVLVHSGSVHGGHYFAYIRPCPRLITSVEPKIDEKGRKVYPDAGKWYRFDDEEVRRVPKRLAVSNNFGGIDDYSMFQNNNRRPMHRRDRPRASSAYMLVYVNYKETLYHPRMKDLLEKTKIKIEEEKKKMENLEKEEMRQQQVHQEKENRIPNNLEGMKKRDSEAGEVPPLTAVTGPEGNNGNGMRNVGVVDRKDVQRNSEVERTQPKTEGKDANRMDTNEGMEKKGGEDGMAVVREAKMPLRQTQTPQEEMEVDGADEKELADGKAGPPERLGERLGEKRKRKDVDQDHIRRRRRKLSYSALEQGDDSNEGADIPVPKHLLGTFKREEDERKRREEERARAHLFHEINILCETELLKVEKMGIEFTKFKEFEGLQYPYNKPMVTEQEKEEINANKNDNTNAIADQDKQRQQQQQQQQMFTGSKVPMRSIKVLKENTLEDIKEEVAKTFGISPDELQYWIYSDRENQTQRPNRVIESSKVKNAQTWSELMETNNNRYNNPQYYGRHRKPLELFLRRRLPTDVEADQELIEAVSRAEQGSRNVPETENNDPQQGGGAMEGSNPNPDSEKDKDRNNNNNNNNTNTSPITGPKNKPEPGKLLLFKYFDVDQQVMRYVGSGVFPAAAKFRELYPLLRSMVGLAADMPLRLYEEESVHGGQINICDPDTDLQSFKLLCGDIICFQKVSGGQEQEQQQAESTESTTAESSQEQGQEGSRNERKEDEKGDNGEEEKQMLIPPSKYFDVKQYLEYLNTRIDIEFRAKEEPANVDKKFSLELLRNYSIKQITRHVAKYLGCNHNYVRVTNSNHQDQYPQYPNRADDERLNLDGNGCILMYEKLSYSLLDLTDNFLFDVKWLRPGLETEQIEVLVPRNAKVGDLRSLIIKEARKRFPEEMEEVPDRKQVPDGKHSSPEDLVRLVGIKSGVIKLVAKMEEEVGKYVNPNLHVTRNFPMLVDHIRAEIVDKEERDRGQKDQVVKVFFYNMNVYGHPETEDKAYVPFFFVIKEGETFADVKQRLAEKIKSKRLGAFKIKRVTDLVGPQVEEIQEGCVMTNLGWENCYIGLEVQFKRSFPSMYDRPMKILAS